ncbi:MAG TPA: hypothetical protein VHY75_15600 [Steroidobacteraceae bacterium]|nr:hypothetical protein [Steroidobacteraceae bacterium]
MASWVGAASLALAACTLSGYEGYDGGGVDVGYVGGYYEPWGYEYGGWGNRYWVGPPRGDRGHGRDHGPGGGHPHGGGRPVGGGRGGAPSIPSRPR